MLKDPEGIATSLQATPDHRPVSTRRCIEVRLEAGQSGPTLSFRASGDRWIRLHSARDPLGEADCLIQTAFAGGEPASMVVIGLGLGYVLDAIEARSTRTRVLAFEPLASAVPHMRARRDWSSWDSTGRLVLLTGPDYVGSTDAWRQIDVTSEPPLIVVHPVLRREFGDLVGQAYRKAEQVAFGASSNYQARKKFSGLYLLNTLSNLPVIERAGNIAALHGRFSGLPAVVLGAGPSLDRNLEELRPLVGRAVVIAADTALRPALLAGIEPDLVVAVDPQELNARHLRGLPPCPRTCLVAEGSSHPSAFEAFGDRTFIFKVSNHHPWPWLRSFELDAGHLRAWGSVIVTATDLALKLGCDPIIYLGADLAFTDGQPYCRGTTFEGSWAEATSKGTPLPSVWRSILESSPLQAVVDVSGQPNRTRPTLEAFRDWIVEESRAAPKRRFINATGRGILTGGRLVQARLDDVLADAGTARPGIERTIAVVLASQTAARTPKGIPTGIARDDEVVDDWIRHTVGTVTFEQIEAVFKDRARRGPGPLRAPGVVTFSGAGVATCSRLRGLGPRCPLPSTSRIPERAAAIRVASVGTDMPSWIHMPTRNLLPGEWEFVGNLVQETTEVLCRLMTLEEPAMGLLPGYESLPASQAQSVSLTAAFDWSPAARPDVDTLERLVRKASGFASGTLDRDAVDAFRWSVEPSNQPGANGTPDANLPHSKDALTWWARRALVIEWATVLKALPAAEESGSDGAALRLAEWLRDLADGPLPVALDQSSVSLRVRVAGGDAGEQSLEFDLRTTPWRLMRALTGSIVRVADDEAAESSPVGPITRPALVVTDLAISGRMSRQLLCTIEDRSSRIESTQDPRLRFLHKRDGWIQPKVLDLPSAFLAGSIDEATALVTPYLARRSWAVDSAGSIRELPEWPYPIVGEQRGSGGHAVAWSNVGSCYLMRRSADGAETQTEAASFRPSRAIVFADGSSFWSSMSGGLWHWEHDGRISCVASMPPTTGISLEQDGIRLDPVGTDVSGQVHRRVLNHGWTWDLNSGSLAAVPLGTLGQRCRLARSQGAWASAHPAADLIRVGRDNTSCFDVACEWPNDVAWAGDSLVIVTARGAALVLHGIRRLME